MRKNVLQPPPPQAHTLHICKTISQSLQAVHAEQKGRRVSGMKWQHAFHVIFESWQFHNPQFFPAIIINLEFLKTGSACAPLSQGIFMRIILNCCQALTAPTSSIIGIALPLVSQTVATPRPSKGRIIIVSCPCWRQLSTAMKGYSCEGTSAESFATMQVLFAEKQGKRETTLTCQMRADITQEQGKRETTLTCQMRADICAKALRSKAKGRPS
eukprot:1157750-Pelagomonas_calceolata.AAC.17